MKKHIRFLAGIFSGILTILLIAFVVLFAIGFIKL